jgi:hypothetical protein
VLVSKLIVFEVRVNGAENVNAFSFVVNKVAVDTFKFDMLVVCPFINNIDADENVFKLFVNPDIDKYDALETVFKLVNIVLVVDVKFDILVVCPLINNIDEDEKEFKLLDTFDIDKNDIITYALERMQDLVQTEEFGVKPNDFDPDIFFKHAIGITSSKDEPITIVLKADKIASKYILSQPFHSSQRIIKEGKNRTSFELKIVNSEEFVRSILSYGNGIEIIEPESLRNEMISRIKGLAKLYEI